MSETKFTPGPWEKRRKTIGDFTGISIFGENCPIGLIAKLPFRNEFALIREYKEKFSQEEVDANAQLISCSPDLYASEEKNLELLKIPYHAFQYMLALCKADVKMQTFVVDQLKVKFEDIEKFAKEYEERIAETEQLLKKARGEE